MTPRSVMLQAIAAYIHPFDVPAFKLTCRAARRYSKSPIDAIASMLMADEKLFLRFIRSIHLRFWIKFMKCADLSYFDKSQYTFPQRRSYNVEACEFHRITPIGKAKIFLSILRQAIPSGGYIIVQIARNTMNRYFAVAGRVLKRRGYTQVGPAMYINQSQVAIYIQRCELYRANVFFAVPI